MMKDIVKPEMPIFDLNLDKLEEEPETIYMEDSGSSSLPVTVHLVHLLQEIEITRT